MDKPIGYTPSPVPEFEFGRGRPILGDLHMLLGQIDNGIVTDIWAAREFVANVIRQMHERDVEAKQMVEYGYLATEHGERQDPRFYENQPDQHDTNTATVWALHLHIPRGTGAERAASRDKILARMSVLPEPTGEYMFGDSWMEWGEPIKNASDAHMVVYFKADPERAAGVGLHLAQHATFALEGGNYDLVTDYAVSTSGDYAEIIR